jgi:hypothetical protein
MERSPNAEEAAAIAAAVQRFEADTAPAAKPSVAAVNPWQRAALVEGAGAKGTVQRHLEGGAKWPS